MQKKVNRAVILSIMKGGSKSRYTVFVYGTLKYTLIRTLVLRRLVPHTPYTLERFRRERLNIVPDPHAVVEGLLLTVSDDDLKKLDQFERVGRRYERKEISCNGNPCFVYVRMPK